MGLSVAYQTTRKPYGSSGCSAICCAVQRNNGSSMWKALPEKGKRQASVARVSDNREWRADHFAKMAGSGCASWAGGNASVTDTSADSDSKVLPIIGRDDRPWSGTFLAAHVRVNAPSLCGPARGGGGRAQQ